MLGLNTLSESRQVSLKGYMIICSLFSLLPASPRPSWRGADTAKPRQDFLSSAVPLAGCAACPLPVTPLPRETMAKGSFLFVILDPAEEEPSGRSCPRGPSVHSSSGSARRGCRRLGRPRAFRSSPGLLGGHGLETHLALLRGERRGMENLGGVSGLTAPQGVQILSLEHPAQRRLSQCQEELGYQQF